MCLCGPLRYNLYRYGYGPSRRHHSIYIIHYILIQISREKKNCKFQNFIIPGILCALSFTCDATHSKWNETTKSSVMRPNGEWTALIVVVLIVSSKCVWIGKFISCVHGKHIGRNMIVCIWITRSFPLSLYVYVFNGEFCRWSYQPWYFSIELYDAENGRRQDQSFDSGS